jgi:hypothetical protein
MSGFSRSAQDRFPPIAEVETETLPAAALDYGCEIVQSKADGLKEEA